MYEQTRFAQVFDVNSHYYSDLLNDHVIKSIRDLVSDTDVENIFSLKYDGVYLGHQIEMAVTRYLLKSSVDINKNEALIKEFAYSTLASYEATKRLISELNPQFVLMSHGVYATWGGAIEACKNLNIRTIVWGRGYVKGNIIADFNDSYAFTCPIENNENWENIILNNTQKEKLKDYFINKRNPEKTDDYINYYSDNQKLLTSKHSFLRAGESRFKFSLFPNIPWDGSTYSSSSEFPSIKVFIQVTLEWFLKHPEHDLIIRAHPAEVVDKYNATQETIKNIINQILPELPGNIIFIEPDSSITSYDVSDACDVNLLYASTMGLELSYAGKSVIQTGQSMISNKGIVFEPKNVTEYYEFLESASKNKLEMSQVMKDRVEKYAYHWIFKRHIPENTYAHKALTFTKFKIKSTDDLAPGNDRVIDWFIDRCEDGKPFIWDDNA